MINSNVVHPEEESEDGQLKLTVVEPHSERYLPDLNELWRFRHLYYALVWRNLRVRYKNTIFGAFWIMLQPLLQMLVYTMIFGLWARIPVNSTPYSIHVLSGLVLIFFLNRVVGEAANVVRSNQNLTRKVYFPKFILPCVLTTSAAVDLAVALVLLTGIMTAQGVLPAATVLFAPIFLFMTIALAFGLALWFAALGIRFRDVALLTPIIGMLMTYLSPVVYPISMVPDKYLPIYALNPMAGIVTGFRWSVLGVEPFYPWMVAISAIEIILIGSLGMLYFIRTEHKFNDYL